MVSDKSGLIRVEPTKYLIILEKEDDNFSDLACFYLRLQNRIR